MEISLNVLHKFRWRMPGSANDDTIIVNVIDPDGLSVSSADPVLIGDGWWGSSFTPTKTGNYTATAVNQTTDIEREAGNFFAKAVSTMTGGGGTTFTTWAALKTKIQNDMMNFKFGVRNYQVGGRQITYSTWDEILKAYEFVSAMASTEASSNSGRRITLLKNGGTGRW